MEGYLVPVSRYLKVFRGSRRGWDPLFFPPADTNIEPQFMKDVLMNARDTDSYVAIPTSGRKAFCCNLEMRPIRGFDRQEPLNEVVLDRAAEDLLN